MRNKFIPAMHHTLSAGIVPVRHTERGYVYLLLRAYKYWDFPKGGVQPTEAPLTAARRETEEETGITELQFAWGHIYTETPPYARGKIARYYLATTQQEKVVLGINPELSRPEHHEYRWMTYQEARPLLVPRLQNILDWAHSIITSDERTVPSGN